MKFSVDYLLKFIDKPITSLSDLKSQLIELGIEVESIIKDQFREDLLEVSLAPNRADLLSIVGIARELAIINNAKVKLPEIKINPKINLKNSIDFKINITAVKACPKYLGRIISNIKQNITTPEWIAKILQQADLKLISPIVDITNYVMLELGQPLHAFDFSNIHSKQINVRTALPHESIELLNGQKINLTTEDLIIADHKHPLAIAGVMGGMSAAITANTKDLFLECAYFEPIGIRMTSKRHNIISDASQRFTRSIDPKLQELAMDRCCDLLLEIVGGEIVTDYNFIDPKNLSVDFYIDLFKQKISKLLGIKIYDEKILNILQGIGATVTDLIDGWKVKVPTWRTDLRIQEDLIEELAKHIGYKNIIPTKISSELDFTKKPQKNLGFSRELKIKNCMANRGYNEVINYSFIDRSLAEKFNPGEQLYALKNPISNSMGVMRVSLWPGLINNLIYNQNRQIDRVRLFEVGTVFNLDHTSKQVNEHKKLAGLISGKLFTENWQKFNQEVDFFALKNDVIAIIQSQNFANFEFVPQQHPALHPHRAAQIKINNLAVGFLGALHPELAAELSINKPVYVFELDLHAVANSIVIKFNQISKFPLIRRDFSILMDLNTPIIELENIIKSTCGKLLKELIFFDVFTGSQLPTNKKSIAFGVVLQDLERTLIEEEINKIVQNLLLSLKSIGELRS